MSAKDSINQYQFRSYPLKPDDNPYGHPIDNMWRIAIVKPDMAPQPDTPHGGRQVGFLEWTPSEISNIEIDPGHERKGLATEAFRKAERLSDISGGRIPAPRHSETISKEGRAWVRSLGKEHAEWVDSLGEDEYDYD